MQDELMNPVVDNAEDAAEYLDCRGLRCPMPIVRISKAVKKMTIGQTLVVEASDPAFPSDIRAWIKTMGYELVEFTDGPIQKAVIRKV